MAVNRIDAPDDRDCDLYAFRVDRRSVESISGRHPFLDARIGLAVRARVAAAQDRAEPVFLHFFRCDRTIVGLDDLTDFLFQRHLGHDLVDARFDGRIDEIALYSRPYRSFGSRFACVTGRQ